MKTLHIFHKKVEVNDMLNQNESKCPRCWRKYKLSVNPRPISIKDWEEDEKQITNYKFVCSCGCSWERTKVEDKVNK